MTGLLTMLGVLAVMGIITYSLKLIFFIDDRQDGISRRQKKVWYKEQEDICYGHIDPENIYEAMDCPVKPQGRRRDD